MPSQSDQPSITARALVQAVEALGDARDVVVLTGAGISVESGIPHFRSAGGLWERYDPFEYATRSAFRQNPARCWQLFDELADVVESAKPNPAHTALAQWERHLDRLTVITQNIDGLHQAAGSTTVLEFHGGASALACIWCDERHDAPPVAEVWPPICHCGEILKPDIVLFGDPIPAGVWERSVEAMHQADAVLVVGTSAQVAPFSELPWIASRIGVPVVEVNLESTALAQLPTLLLQGPAGSMVPSLVGAITGAPAPG